jgi:glycosyltransferase involved in cell wall biosynthesis
VQTCDLYTNILGLPGAALAGVPVRIGSRRELNPDKTAGQIRLQRQSYRCATKVVANSSAARRMLEAEGLATTSIAVIPNVVTVPPRRADSDSGVTRARRRVITVANLRPEKSHETLLDAAARLVPGFPDLEILVVGDGPRRAELERRVREQALSHTVRFLGHREDVADLLAASDAFVLPSISEAFPNSAIEAMAAGLPVVASATGGLLDLIEHGRTGLLFEPGDADALADALAGLLCDRARAARLGDAARDEVTARYSFERMVRTFEDLYLAGLPARARSRAHRAQAAGI